MFRRVRLTQTSADTDKSVPFPIPLAENQAVDFMAFEFIWLDAYATAPVDVIVKLSVQLVEVDTSPDDMDVVRTVHWQNASDGFGATWPIVAFPNQGVLPEPVRVVHKCWVRCETANTGQSNDFVITGYFREVKLSPTEYARLRMVQRVYSVDPIITRVERPRRRTLRRGVFTGTFRGSFVG